jgi:MarR family transcriptional regulator for hemolysin
MTDPNTSDNEREYVGRTLALAHKAMRAEFDARLAEVGGSLSTWVVLRGASHVRPRSQRELAAVLGVEGPTLVRHLDRLAADGLIERRPDPHDRRVTRVVVTAKGRRLFDRLVGVAEANEAEVRDLLGATGYRAVRSALRLLHEHYATLGDERRSEDDDANGPGGRTENRRSARRGDPLRGAHQGVPRDGRAGGRPARSVRPTR